MELKKQIDGSPQSRIASDLSREKKHLQRNPARRTIHNALRNYSSWAYTLRVRPIGTSYSERSPWSVRS